MQRHGPLIAGSILLAWSSASLAAEPAGEACEKLKDAISVVSIELPTRGASVQTAELVAPTPLKAAELPFGPLPPYLAVVPAAPEYCKIVGEIAPVDAKAPPIRFQVNLPTQWNGASVQFGGGGFNGTLITGLGLAPLARADQPSPLAQGFVTYGTDSGHQTAPGTPLQAFALNDEALTNFAYASYKKVRDVAVELMQRRYGRKPAKLYFAGFSEGGREGLTMAQRFPNDFDGIISGVPVINWVALQTAGTRVGAAQFNSGWLDPDKVKFMGEAVLTACDRLDGLADGIVSNYESCKRTFDSAKLACKVDGQSPDGRSQCLSAAQLEAVRLMHSPVELGFSLANGIRSYPGWGLGGETTNGTGPIGGWMSWQTGTDAPTLPPGPKNSRAWLYGSGAVQYFFARDPNFDASKFDPARFAERMKEVSSLMDSTNPDLSRFLARGGKIIMYENMADYAQSPYAGIAYYKSVVDKMGAAKVDGFLQLFILPGVDHMGTGAPASVDLLSALTAWVEKSNPPGELTVAAQESKAPFTVTATRPLCRYPAYPHYAGGDVKSAEVSNANRTDAAMNSNNVYFGRRLMMNMKNALILLACFACTAAKAETSDNVVRVGVLNDISGVFQDTNGMGSVEAARMAAEDFAGGGKNIKVEIVYADHQNKADVGVAIARKWLDVEGVDAIVDVPNSAVGLAINSLLRDSRMTFLASSTASSDLTGKACSPNTIQWVNDTWATGNTTASAMMANGAKNWYFVTVDYALGKGIEAEASKYIETHGGKILGSAKHPLGTSDFASFLLQAQSSKADVIGLANAGGDSINAVKQAAEFGIQQGGQKLVAFLLFINDVHGMGLKVAQGLQLMEAFYWDANDDARAFAKRFAARPGMNGKMPSGNQAGVYASTLAYLNAVAATGSDNAKDVVPQMKKFSGKDKLFGDVTIRQDGRVIHPLFLFEVKKPEESKYPYDYYKLIATIPADKAFRPMAEGGCSLVK